MTSKAHADTTVVGILKLSVSIPYFWLLTTVEWLVGLLVIIFYLVDFFSHCPPIKLRTYPAPTDHMAPL